MWISYQLKARPIKGRRTRSKHLKLSLPQRFCFALVVTQMRVENRHQLRGGVILKFP